MASYLTDSEREERYAKNRIKRNRYNKFFDIAMWVALLLTAIDVLPAVIASVLSFNPILLFQSLPAALAHAGVILAIYRKDFRFSLVAMGICLLITMLCSGDAVLPLFLLIPVTSVSYQWMKLSQEEGFPLFDISYAEREEAHKVAERRAEHRALAAGMRAASTAQTDDMHDLLDAERDLPVMAKHVSGYHDRFHDGVIADQVSSASQQPGVMDTLEALTSDAPIREEETPYGKT